jgi:hypothetical protein
MMAHHYYGIIFGKMKVTLALLHASLALTGSQASVWLGASNHSATRWVQAGIEIQSGNHHPFVYIEVERNGRTSLRRWSVPWSHVSRVHLHRFGDWWQVTIGGHSSPWVRVPDAKSIATLETYLTTGVNKARINGRLVSGD